MQHGGFGKWDNVLILYHGLITKTIYCAALLPGTPKIAHIIICSKSNVHNFEVVLKVEDSAEFIA